jgi:hypothetical protein
MLQGLFKMFHLFPDVCCNLCLSGMLQRYIPNISTVLVLCCSKWFYVASYKSGCFVRFTHMLQVRVPDISSLLDICCIQMFFMLQVFYVVRPRASRGRADWACGAPRPADGAVGCRRTEVLRSGGAGGVLVLNSSS